MIIRKHRVYSYLNSNIVVMHTADAVVDYTEAGTGRPPEDSLVPRPRDTREGVGVGCDEVSSSLGVDKEGSGVEVVNTIASLMIARIVSIAGLSTPPSSRVSIIFRRK